MLGIFWVMVVLGVLGIVVVSSEPEHHAQKANAAANNKSAPSDEGRFQKEEGQRSRWAEYKEKIEQNERVITAVSTVLVAIFTVGLFLATAFLYKATKNLVEGADDTSRRQLRAYIGLHASEATVYPFEQGGLRSLPMLN